MVLNMEAKNIQDAIKELRKAKKRKFTQSIDLIINLQKIDLKKPENKFTEEVFLPSGRGKDAKIGVIGKNLAVSAKGVADYIVDDPTLDKLEKDKKALKSAIKDVDYFLAEAPYMLRIGKTLGRVLGPKGKMPKPLPPNADIKPIAERLKKTVRVKLSGSPVIQTFLGTESLKDEEIKANFEAVLSAVEKKLPLGKDNIKNVYLKTTMGSPISVKYR